MLSLRLFGRNIALVFHGLMPPPLQTVGVIYAGNALLPVSCGHQNLRVVVLRRR